MILCCGEALIDMIPEDTLSGGSGFVPKVGGAVFNTAVALGRLGRPSGMMTGISRDVFGEQLMTELARSGVATDAVVRNDQPTTLAFVHLEDGNAQYTFYRENAADTVLTAADLHDVSDATAFFFGGISLCTEPAATAFAAVQARVAPTHVTMIDPNIRAAFIRDEQAYRERLMAMIARADILKVSDDDLDWIDAGPGTTSDKIARLPNADQRIVLVTRGGEGAEAFRGGDVVAEVPAARADVVDTVGAGDTFNAGFMAALDQTGRLTKPAVAALSADEITAAMQFAARVAAITVGRQGADPPWAGEL